MLNAPPVVRLVQVEGEVTVHGVASKNRGVVVVTVIDVEVLGGTQAQYLPVPSGDPLATTAPPCFIVTTTPSNC